MAYQAGTAFLQVLPSLKGLHTKIRAELAGIKASIPVQLETAGLKSQMAGVRAALGDERVTVKASADTAEARRDVAGFGATLKGLTDKEHRVKVDIDKRPVVDSANAVATLTRNLSGLAVGVIGGAAVPALTALTGALVQTSGALLLVPAGGLASAAAVTTLKVATMGLDDVFKNMSDPKKFAESLAKVSPEARTLAIDVRALQPAFQSVQWEVQDRLLRGFGSAVQQVAGTYLPVLRTGMGGIASEFNNAGMRVVQFVQNAQTVRDVQSIFAGTQSTVRNLTPALTDVLTMVRDIGAVGMQFLPGLATGFSNATTRAREFVSAARESGQLAGWIQGGIDNLRLLGQIALNAGGILMGVWRGSDSDAQGFLRTLVGITDKWREWVNSAQGQGVIRDFFASLRDIGAGLMPILGFIVGAFVELVTRVGPLMPSLADAFMRVANAAKPVLDIFWDLVMIVLPPLLDLIGLLAPVLGPFIGIAVAGAIAIKGFSAALGLAKLALEGAKIAWAALNFVMGLSPFGMIVIAIGLLVAALIYAWNNSETFRNVVTAAWEAVKNAGQTLWNKLNEVFTWISTKATELGSWLTTVFNDIKTTVSSVGQFFSDLYNNWVKPAFEGIVTIGKWALAILITAVFLPIQIAINTLEVVWNSLKEIAVQAFRMISEEAQIWWDFLSGIFTAVYDYVSGVFSRVFEGWKLLVIGAFTAVRDEVTRWWNTYVQPILNIVIDFFVGPLSTGFTFWRDVTIAVFNAVWALVQQWWNTWVRPLMDTVINFFTVTVPNAFEQFRALVSEKWNALWLFISDWWNAKVQPTMNTVNTFFTVTVPNAFEQFRASVSAKWEALWNFIRDWWNVWVQPLLNTVINFVTVTLPNGFQRGVDAIGRVWNAIKAALRQPLQVAIDIVWNNGIHKVWDMVRGVIPGLPAIPGANFQLPGLAAGGPVNKPTVAMIGEAGPEYVLSAPAVRNMGGMGAVDALHRGATTPRAKVRAMNQGGVVEGADHNGPGTSTSGFGGVRPHVAQAGHYLKNRFGIGTVGGVGARANASDHPGGLALDFMTSGENGTALNNFLLSQANWNHFAVKYTIWRQRYFGNPGAAGTFMANRGSPTANHMDHVHVSFTGTPGVGGMDGGGGGPSILDLLTNAWSLVRDQVGKLAAIGNSPWGQAVIGFGKKVVDTTWNWLAGKAGEMMAAAAQSVGSSGVVSGTIGGSSAVRATVAGVASRYGWGTGAEWTALQTLIQKESSWNPNAQNPTSTAYGLFQFLNSTWGSVGATRTSNPGLQAEAGLRYIQQKYGSPSRALAFHNANNWYDAGGRLNGRGLFYKQTMRPERVLSDRQNRAFERMVDAIDRSTRSRTVYTGAALDAVGGTGRSTGPLVGTLVAQVPPGATAHEVVDVALFRLRHTRRGLHA